MLIKLGFSGSIATGKTARCNQLVTVLAPQRFNRVKMLSADMVGHQTYLPGTTAYNQLVTRFGEGILDKTAALPAVGMTTSASMSVSAGAVAVNTPTSTRLPVINRRALGEIVFKDPNALNALNEIVWPALRDTIQGEMVAFENKVRLKNEVAQMGRVSSGVATNQNYAINANIFICEAALLIECGLDSLFDEVWLLGCAPDEAIRRIMERDGLTAEQARMRIATQKSLAERQHVLESKGFITSTPSDNEAFNVDCRLGARTGDVYQRYANAHRILRTFDTTQHATVADGMGEIGDAFEAMTNRWIGPAPH